MHFELPVLGFLVTLALMVGIVLWVLSVSGRSGDERRKQREANRIAHQPWDSAGGRANR